MTLRTLLGAAAAACVLALVTGEAISQDKETKSAIKKQTADLKRQAGQIDPQMKAWMQAATPGPNHKLLGYCVGTWDAHVRSWMGPPGTDPQESKGVSVSKWVLGGRYVQSDYNGEAMGMPFSGIGYAGYDNVKKVFTSCWMDTMGTGMMIDEGTYDAATKTFTYASKAPCPTGGTIESKTVIRVVNKDQHIMTIYNKMPGMDEMTKALEITYSRTDKSAKPE